MNFPSCVTDDPDILAGYTEDGSGEHLVPQAVARPRSTEEVVSVIEFCRAHSLSITPAGARTNDTAGALSSAGMVLSLERMKGIREVNTDDAYVIAEAGIILGDLKTHLAEENLFYAPDPTSENIASLGGTIATNAAGARSYKYGATANHVLGLEVVLADGSVHWIEKSLSSKQMRGPEALRNLTDIWVGSEGTLGIITAAKLRCTSGIPDAFQLFVFFPSLDKAVQFAIDTNTGTYVDISPRSLEFMDNTCLDLLRSSGKYKAIPAEARCAIFTEQEIGTGKSDELLEAWLERLEEAGALVDHTIVADSPTKISELRELRHHVPATVWERGKEAQTEGGRKVSTDWAVPIQRFPEMLERAAAICEEFGFGPARTFRYGHLGDGHPHFNFVPSNNAELEKCFLLRKELCRLAVSLGGTVSAEHGIGKARKDLLELEDEPLRITLLRALKSVLDPEGIMAPGNLLD